jgi:hypothetical protein
MIKLLDIKKSTRNDKKLMAVFEINGSQKTVHFGADGYKDYTLYYKEDPEIAEDKKSNYISRHSAREDFENPITAGALSYWILWNKPTIEESIKDYKKHFNFDKKINENPKSENDVIVSPVNGEIVEISNNSVLIHIRPEDNHFIYSPITRKITNITMENGFWTRKVFQTVEYKTGRLTIYQNDIYFSIEVGKLKYVTDRIRFNYNIGDEIQQGEVIGEILIGSLAKIYLPPQYVLNKDIIVNKKLKGGITELAKLK